MTPDGRRDVAILGGGMAGLAAAWRLSDPANAERIGTVTVYQRGWQLGGKGASGRGAHGRIEEHGLHVWLGYYDNAFRLVRESYEELDRPTTDPTCPIRTWDEAFAPAPHVGLFTRDGGAWVAMFSPNDQLPGEPGGNDAPMSPVELLTRGLRLLADFARSLDAAPPPGRVVMTPHPEPPTLHDPGWAPIARQAANLAMAAALEVAAVGGERLDALVTTAGFGPLFEGGAPLGVARDQLRQVVGEDPARRRWFELLDLVVTSLRGVVVDRLLTDPRGLQAIDDEEFCDWLRRHGAAEETVASALVTGVYDLAFASVDGDPGRKRFGAGTGLYMSALMYFGYRGSMFWKMQAGMGDVVFAPLHQALVARGVRIEYFSRVDEVVPGPAGTVDRLRLTRQARPRGERYEPLVDVGGLPCFPAEPRLDQLADPPERWEDLATAWDGTSGTSMELVRDEDFDDVVVAMSVGILGRCCARLVEADPRWAAMVEGVSTVATQSLQLWLDAPEEELGVPPGGVTITGGTKPFDTMASMTHLLPVEQWPSGAGPRSLLYLCSSFDGGLPDADDAEAGRRAVETGRAQVRANAESHLDRSTEPLLPAAQDPTGFRWELLHADRDREGPARLDDQYWSANVDPSDRYVQAVPGSGRHRLRPDDSGWANLALAGDWTDCGLNVGCIEAATVSGLQAANAVLHRPRWDRISGYWEPLERR